MSEMTDFKAKMHQIRFQLGLRCRPRWWSLQRSPRPPSWIWGALLLRRGEGREERGRDESEGEGRGGKARAGEGKERAMSPPTIWRKFTPMHTAMRKHRHSNTHCSCVDDGWLVGHINKETEQIWVTASYRDWSRQATWCFSHPIMHSLSHMNSLTH